MGHSHTRTIIVTAVNVVGQWSKGYTQWLGCSVATV